MSVEGVAGILAGAQAYSLGVMTRAASSFVEALASLIVVWRFRHAIGLPRHRRRGDPEPGHDGLLHPGARPARNGPRRQRLLHLT
jgi:hypothetical protein